MRTIPAGFRDADVTDLHVCWRIIRRDGVILYGTECDEDLPLDTSSDYPGTYLAAAGITGSDIRSTSDMSPDNLEVTGALQDPDEALYIFDLTAADLEAGAFDNAQVVTFLVNAEDPNAYQHVLRDGWFGNVTRTAEGQYKTEHRGLTQALSQNILKTYGVGCQWELGDDDCRVDLTPWIDTNEVTVVTSRREFQVDHHMFPTAFTLIPGGRLTFTSGANTGRSKEIKSYASLVITLWEPMAEDVVIGDTMTVQIGCDKAHLTCINTFNNVNNFGGWAIFVPGQNEILKVGTRR